jgi:hypothetical protein
MNPATELKLAQVRKYSASLRRVFRFLAVFVAIGAIISVLVLLTRPNRAGMTLLLWGREIPGEDLTWTLKILASIWLLLIFAIALKLLHHLAALFDLYSRGLIFTAENVLQIRRIGISVFLFVLSYIYVAFAQIFLFATDQPLPTASAAGDRIDLDFDGPFPFAQIITGIIIIVVSWIMDVGRELREEADLTV